MKNNKGFTLIEILSVVIIMGIIILIAVPSVSKYVNDSRISAYVTTAKEYIKEAQTKVASKEYELFDKKATYYISIDNLKLENDGESPFGEWVEAYVVVTYIPPDGYQYYWTSLDSSGFKVNLTKYEDLDTDDVLKTDDLVLGEKEPIGDRDRIIVVEENEP